MKIGIELEAGFNRYDVEEIEQYCESIDAQFKHDGSIRTHESENLAREVATRPYELNEMNQIAEDFDVIYSYVQEVNSSMGMHVHFSFNKQDTYNCLFNRKFNAYFKKELKKRYKGNNELLRRLTENSYTSSKYEMSYFQRNDLYGASRYKFINWRSYSKFKTVEFRIFDAPKTQKQLMDYLIFLIFTVKKYVSTYKFKVELDVEIEENELQPLNLEITEEIEEKLVVTI